MLTQKDKDFIAKLDLSKWEKREQFYVMWIKLRDYAIIEYDGCPIDKLNELIQAAQIRFGKEELARRNNK